MDSSSSRQQQKHVDNVMEVPEIHGDLLIELLDASENATGQQLASLADVDVDVDGDCWIDSQENHDIHLHAHHDYCEDCCGLDDGILLPDFDEHGTTKSSRSPYPYFVFDHGHGHDDDTLGLEYWAETTADAMDPFGSDECTGDWYMDGLVMAMEMEWEEQEQDGGSGGFPFEPCCYGDDDGGDGAGAAEQVYASPFPFPLWE